MYEIKNNTGTLFKNDRKEADNHPDYKGTALVDGVEMWMSAWLKTSAKGQKFMSFSFKRKEPAPEADFREKVEQTFGKGPVSDQFEPRDSDIPF